MFEATVRTCRDGCQPAYCNNLSGRSEPSFGRKKRSLNETADYKKNNNNNNATTETDIEEEFADKKNGNLDK